MRKTFKIVFLGHRYSGQTNVIRRFASSHYCHETSGTVGVDFALKRDEVNDIFYQFWDVGSYADYRNFLSRVYVRNGCVLVLTARIDKQLGLDRLRRSEPDISKLKTYMTPVDPDADIPVVLLFTCCDVEKEKWVLKTEEERANYAALLGAEQWFCVSAKDDLRIAAAWQYVQACTEEVVHADLRKTIIKESINAGFTQNAYYTLLARHDTSIHYDCCTSLVAQAEADILRTGVLSFFSQSQLSSGKLAEHLSGLDSVLQDMLSTCSSARVLFWPLVRSHACLVLLKLKRAIKSPGDTYKALAKVKKKSSGFPVCVVMIKAWLMMLYAEMAFVMEQQSGRMNPFKKTLQAFLNALDSVPHLAAAFAKGVAFVSAYPAVFESHLKLIQVLLDVKGMTLLQPKSPPFDALEAYNTSIFKSVKTFVPKESLALSHRL